MSIWHEQRDHCFIITIEETDLTESLIDQMRQLLTVAFLRKNYNLILDLSSCKTIDSYFVGLLISTHNDIKNLGGRLFCTGVSGQVAHAFDAIRLNQLVTLHKQVDEAAAECIPSS